MSSSGALTKTRSALFLAKAVSQLFSIFILASFVVIGVWGHKTHWRFSLTEAVPVSEQGESEEANATVSSAAAPLIVLSDKMDLSDQGIQLASARTQTLRTIVQTVGTVTYNGQKYSQLSTKTRGHVVHVFVRAGQRVAKDEVLAIIDSQEVGEAKSDFLQKKAEDQFATTTLNNLRQADSGAIPMSRIREAEADARDAKLAVFMTEQRLMNLGLPLGEFDINETPEELAEHFRDLGIPDAVLNRLPARPMTANLIGIFSPFDGVVVEQHAVIGEMVSPDQYQFVVADTSTMWLKLSVRREDAVNLAVGQEVEFSADGMAEPFRTTLSWISSEIEAETQTVQAGCEVQNGTDSEHPSADPDDSKITKRPVLRANQFGNATIVTSENSAAIVVPEAAIQRMPNMKTVVFVQRGGGTTFEVRNVSPGIHHSGMVQIAQGLSEGEIVVTEGSFILKSEMMRSTLVGG